jgi:alpha-N-acetylglucosamine transferase
METLTTFLYRPQGRKLLFLVLAAGFTVFTLTLLNHKYQTTVSYTIPNSVEYSVFSDETPIITPIPSPKPSFPPKVSLPQSPYAIAIFLGADYHGNEDDGDDEDWYYVGARTLVYQLLHAPSTRLKQPQSTQPIPVVIMVTKDVRESKRKRLEADGATLFEIEVVEHDFDIGEPRYAQVLTKLRLFDSEIMPYEKVFLMDTDMVITRPIDGIFQDESTHLNPVDQNETYPELEFASLPHRFTFAATPESLDKEHEYPYLDPSREKQYFNVGCMLFSPSKEIYQYYLSILSHSDLFGHGWPEQDLLNYVHRLDGPMPWGRLHYSWYLNWPNENDLEGGMAIIHSKFWEKDWFGAGEKYALSRVWEMQGYWKGKEGR